VRFLFPNLRILSDLQITAIFCIQISFPTQFVRNAGDDMTFDRYGVHPLERSDPSIVPATSFY
ncbi:hypothetical protein, partial [Microcystis aeruginosa]|uniref:hypothetical protein n=1 Tax=Microcystis aeruginosa TaxID=1126 RepID=UPI001B8BD720